MSRKVYNIGVFISLVAFYMLFGCYSYKPKQVTFKNFVDTRSKDIEYQKKDTYVIDDLGISASNEFKGARLNFFKKLNDSSALAIINPENTPINKSAYYAFKLWSNNERYFYVEFKYPKGFKHRYIPKIKSNNKWKIIDPKNIIQSDSNFTIKVKLNKSPIIVAAQEINSSEDVKNWYDSISRANENNIRKYNFGKSKLGTNLTVLDIYTGDKKNKDLVVLLTRQHPPELTGYYAFKKFLSTILNDRVLSNNFFKKYRILAFPMMNPDGVDLGHWRHNAGGIDLNRDWSKYNQIEVFNTVKLIGKTIKKDNCNLLLMIDFHSTNRDVFYVNKDKNTSKLPNFIDMWIDGLEKNIPNYKANVTISENIDTPVSKGWALKRHKAVGITYEVGDETDINHINIVAAVAAEQMMKILTKKI